MFAQWWNHPVIRPLGAGLLYAALYILATQLSWRLARRLGRAPHTGLVDLMLWDGWSTISQTWVVTFTLAYLWAMLLSGVAATNDVGLGAIDWPAVWPWALGLTAGAAVWLSLLWGNQRRQTKAPGRSGAQASRDSLIWALARLARHEAELGIWRAALAPALGLYWGVWFAVFAKWLMSRTNLALNAQLGDAEQRSRIALDWALDWVSAMLFTFTGSLWLALGARLICHTVAALASGLTARRCAARQGAVALVDDQSQHDQHSEHGGGQHANML